MDVKIIKTEADYAVAMARLSELMSGDLAPNSSQENELELLALVIENFERQTVPPVKPDPIESILFRMDQMNLARKDLVPYLGSLSKVSEVLARKRPLSLPMIRRLHHGLGIPADVLIEDVAVVEDEPTIDYTRFPLKEMRDRGYFGEFQGNLRKLKDYAEDLIKGFMPKHMGPAFLRAPLSQRGDREPDEMAIRAWCMCVLRKAKDAGVTREYKLGTITSAWMRELAKLSAFSNGPQLAMEYLARHGIVFVVERHFNRTFLDGAALLDHTGRPVVALTLRHDRLDNFWFALMHELAHVAHDLTAEAPFFIDDLERADQDAIEERADRIAQEALIPAQSWEGAQVRETLTTEDAVAFANEIGVHPAVVAGRLRHDTKNFRLLNHLIGKTGQVSELLSV